MNIGIYGAQDLAIRCVRAGKMAEGISMLSPTKKEVVEDEFYKYLVAKGYSKSSISDELAKCNSYHHVSISSVKKKVKRMLLLEQTSTDI